MPNKVHTTMYRNILKLYAHVYEYSLSAYSSCFVLCLTIELDGCHCFMSSIMTSNMAMMISARAPTIIAPLANDRPRNRCSSFCMRPLVV